MNEICNYSTKELVEELAKREGVAGKIVDPHEFQEFKVEGPAVILVVID